MLVTRRGDDPDTVITSSGVDEDAAKAIMARNTFHRRSIFRVLLDGDGANNGITTLWEWYFALPFHLRHHVPSGNSLTKTGIAWSLRNGRVYSLPRLVERYRQDLVGKMVLVSPEDRVSNLGGLSAVRCKTVQRRRPKTNQDTLDRSKNAVLRRYLDYTADPDLCSSGILGIIIDHKCANVTGWQSSDGACETSGTTHAGLRSSDERGIDNAEFLHCFFYDRECYGS